MSDTLESMRPQAEQRGLALEGDVVEGFPEVSLDPARIQRVLSNLVQNAIKFTPTGGHISMSSQASNERVLIEVEDECGGLPSGSREDLVRPFVQRSSNRTGLGLGLSISQRVEANGGKLSVRNRPGKGCVFTIDLPRQ